MKQNLNQEKVMMYIRKTKEAKANMKLKMKIQNKKSRQNLMSSSDIEGMKQTKLREEAKKFQLKKCKKKK